MGAMAKKRQALLILLLLIAVNFGCQWAAYYATSGPLNGRAAIVPLHATLAGILLLVRLLPRRSHV